MHGLLLRHFRDSEGVVAILFALLLPVLIGFLGLGFDAARATLVRMNIEMAVDNAVLAATASEGTTAEREALAKSVFQSNYGSGLLAPAARVTVVISTNGDVDVTAAATVPAPFASFFTSGDFDVNVASGGGRGLADIEVVLVVDVSGSMRFDGGNGMIRMEAARKAAHTLLDTIVANKPKSTRLRFAIVPYNVTVNIGRANAKYVSNTNHSLFTGTTWQGCVQERPAPYHLSEAYDPLATDGSGKWHAYIHPPEPNEKRADGSGMCWGDRSNGTNSGYEYISEWTTAGPTDQLSGPNANCVKIPVTPLTENIVDIETAIDNLDWSYNNGTFAASGVAWGMRLLTPGEPFAEAAAFSSSARKIMVFLTDGEQTSPFQTDCASAHNSVTSYQMNPADYGIAGDTLSTTGPDTIWTPFGYLSSNPFGKAPDSYDTQLNEVVEEACQAVKTVASRHGGDRDIELFTLTFREGASSTIATTMANCATDSSHYFHAPGSVELEDAFRNIGEGLFGGPARLGY
ncbi:MAG: TadE/TadG family type IV pilus assembly protein [Geminicoccaceae bacterium]